MKKFYKKRFEEAIALVSQGCVINRGVLVDPDLSVRQKCLAVILVDVLDLS